MDEVVLEASPYVFLMEAIASVHNYFLVLIFEQEYEPSLTSFSFLCLVFFRATTFQFIWITFFFHLISTLNMTSSCEIL